MTEKKAILVVSFGTSHRDTRDKTIGAIESRIQNTYPGWEVRRAFTSGMIMNVLKERDGIHVDHVAGAMESLKQEGYQRVFVQPTHIINGDEYEKMLEQITPYRNQGMEIKIGGPLLTSSQDYEEVCHAITDFVPSKERETALVLMGHGTGHYADAAYAALDYRFKLLGYDHVFVGTVEGYPELGEVMGLLEQYRPKQVILLPLMVVAGDHAVNDMAGDDEYSWKSQLQAAGYKVQCILKGLGESQSIQDIYLRHIASGMEHG